MAETANDTDVIQPEEREDSQEISRREAALGARMLLRRNKNGVLSTASKRHGGWPFGSVAPFALDARGEPVIFISTIAEHTKNLRNDPRVSLFVQDEAKDGDQQAEGRITLLARAERLPDAEVADARARYLARVPGAVGYQNAHDFHFYALRLEHVRYIGGFGRIFWLEPGELRVDPAQDPLAAGARGIIDHMNEDHADALKLYCHAFKGVRPEQVKMIGVDQWGFDVECNAPDVRLRFDFDAPATMETIRPVVVDLVKRARAKLAAAPGA
ncbi:DUF2470 domain-containing protein [Myxococcota bacterium]|nr:DUF2470 domain-containing protein [Myxococcota bacterium]